MFALGKMYKLAEGVEQDMDRSLEFYERAARAHACQQRTDYLDDCKGIDEYILRSDEKVALWARENLGDMYLTGDFGSSENTDKAIEWLKLAADAGSSRAKRILKRNFPGPIKPPAGKLRTVYIHPDFRDSSGLRDVVYPSNLNGVTKQQAYELAQKYHHASEPYFKFAARYYEVSKHLGQNGVEDAVQDIKRQVGGPLYSSYFFAWNHTEPVGDLALQGSVADAPALP